MVDITPHNTYGALTVGTCIAIFLFGVITLQTLDYLTNFREDRRSFRIMVVVIWFLELGNTMSLTSELYRSSLPNSKISLRFDGLGAALIMGTLSTSMVQGFFSRRIWNLLPRPYNLIGVLCLLLAILRTGSTLFLSVNGLRDGNIIKFRVVWAWLILGILGLNTGLDMIIAISLVSFLLSQKNEGFGRFGKVIDKLVAYTIRTGVLTSVTTIVALICFETMPWNFIWMAMYCFLPKLYANSLLSSLVERRRLRRIQDSSSLGLPTFSLSRFSQSNEASGSSRIPPLSPDQKQSIPIVIEMNTTSTSDSTHTFREAPSTKGPNAVNEV